jgi:GH24 family phage-related lysozyme (muramidase)
MEKLLEYNKAGGKVLRGLDNRRKDEAALFRKE